MKITIEIENFDELEKLKQWLALMPDQPNIDLDMPIECLNLTMRTKHCLEAENILTLKDLLEWNEIALLKTPHMGKKSLLEIKDELAIKGLKLKPYNAVLSGKPPHTEI